MRCNQCGKEYISKHGDLKLEDEYIGTFTVPDVEYLECEGCGDLAYSPETIVKIEEAERLALEDKLQSFSLKDFVTATQAATMLGISRQALHKHRRIRRGFIFKTRFADKMFYLRESVERFKETGDGRFSLVEPEKETEYSPEQLETPVLVVYVHNSGNIYTPKNLLSGFTLNTLGGRVSYVG